MFTLMMVSVANLSTEPMRGMSDTFVPSFLLCLLLVQKDEKCGSIRFSLFDQQDFINPSAAL